MISIAGLNIRQSAPICKSLNYNVYYNYNNKAIGVAQHVNILMQESCLLLDICVKLFVKNPSSAHRAGVKGEVKGQMRADHLNHVNIPRIRPA